MIPLPARTPAQYPAGTWRVDPTTSTIAFTVRMMGAKVTGRIGLLEANLTTADELAGSTVSATLDPASIDTGNVRRDAHLRSATFLDVDTHPYAAYRSVAVSRTATGWQIDGELTLHGVTKPVPLIVTSAKFETGSTDTLRISATATVDRTDFGVKSMSGGGLIIGKQVAIALDITAIR